MQGREVHYPGPQQVWCELSIQVIMCTPITSRDVFSDVFCSSPSPPSPSSPHPHTLMYIAGWDSITNKGGKQCIRHSHSCITSLSHSGNLFSLLLLWMNAWAELGQIHVHAIDQHWRLITELNDCQDFTTSVTIFVADQWAHSVLLGYS